MEVLAASESDALAALDPPDAATGESVLVTSADVNAGDYVVVPSLGDRTGRVIELRDDAAIVALGSVKVSVPRRTLVPAVAPAAQERVHVAIRGDVPEVDAKSEIDLRGMRVGEVDDIVMQAVDSAVRADLRMLRIIHGKGTGVLRERVSEMLRKEHRVASFRLGAWNEGGAGVTIAELA